MSRYAEKILEIVWQSHEHMTAEQIYLEMKKLYPRIVLATVYNNLNILTADGKIRRVSVEGSRTVMTGRPGMIIWSVKNAESWRM